VRAFRSRSAQPADNARIALARERWIHGPFTPSCGKFPFSELDHCAQEFASIFILMEIDYKNQPLSACFVPERLNFG
jgi:hypothetical protein